MKKSTMLLIALFSITTQVNANSCLEKYESGFDVQGKVVIKFCTNFFADLNDSFQGERLLRVNKSQIRFLLRWTSQCKKTLDTFDSNKNNAGEAYLKGLEAAVSYFDKIKALEPSQDEVLRKYIEESVICYLEDKKQITHY